MSNKGAIAIIGIVCEEIRIGKIALSNIFERTMVAASKSPNARARKNPAIISCKVMWA